jgi:putative ATPase
MRPKTLDTFIGQEHILGPGKLLRRAIENDKLFSSMILWGPPGTGKTTLATIIANSTKSNFEIISAVTAGVAEIRQLVTTAKQKLEIYNQRTIALVDEIHRFNKAQQDALLPHVENGTIILIGATTENPYFEVISALLSRSRVFSLKSLTQEQLIKLLNQAISDKQNGYGNRQVKITEQAIEHIANIAGGDARSTLNALELAVEAADEDENGAINIDLEIAQEAMQQRALRYDKKGDGHYDTISAFIKSVRGSDPDAALYWLAKMIYAGEDPKFIMRRLFILASEDIGLADPLGIVVVSACAQALEWCGLPEAQYHLAHATAYLATAAKSNSMKSYFQALQEVQKEGKVQVPLHLQDSSRDGKTEGHGQGYKYPHDFPGHWVKQNYMPENMQGKKFYNPSDQGYENKVAERLKKYKPE